MKVAAFSVLLILAFLHCSSAQGVCFSIGENDDHVQGGLHFWGSGPFGGTINIRTISDDFPVKVGTKLVTELDGTATDCAGFGAPDCDYDFSLTFCDDDLGFFNQCVPGTVKSGTFQASGAGPAPRPINGGTGDFNNAAGELVTNGSFQATPPVGGVISLYFEGGIKICVKTLGTPIPIPTPSPTPRPTPRPTRPRFPSIVEFEEFGDGRFIP